MGYVRAAGLPAVVPGRSVLTPRTLMIRYFSIAWLRSWVSVSSTFAAAASWSTSTAFMPVDFSDCTIDLTDFGGLLIQGKKVSLKRDLVDDADDVRNLAA